MPAASRRQPGYGSHSDVFRSRVISVVRRIPPGRVATYGDVAAAAGNARACRAVGNIMRDCRAAGVPCHRVIAAGGKLGGYGGHLELKRALLRAEGIRVVGSTVKDFAERRLSRRSANSAKGEATWGRRGRV
jgi:methylated-DNA-[protein]-cysteine S-methyltransferase